MLCVCLLSRIYPAVAEPAVALHRVPKRSLSSGSGPQHGDLAVFKPVEATREQPLIHRDAPWHESWDNSIAMCAIMRDEALQDVREWLAYYKYVSPILPRST